MFFSKRKVAAATIKRDWATEAADTIERVVDTVRDKAVVPLTTAARWVVFGLLVAVLGVSAAVLSAILLVRILDIYLHNIEWMPDGVWVVHFLVGAIFVVAGLFLWSKRTAKSNAHSK